MATGPGYGSCRSRASSRRSGGRRGLALLLDLGSLAAELAQVVELRAPHVTAAVDLDLRDVRRVHREGALHADAEGDLAHGEGLPDATALPADDDALEDLDPLAGALDDSNVDLQRVARPEVRDVGAQRLGVQCIQGVHRCIRPRVVRAPKAWLSEPLLVNLGESTWIAPRRHPAATTEQVCHETFPQPNRGSV